MAGDVIAQEFGLGGGGEGEREGGEEPGPLARRGQVPRVPHSPCPSPLSSPAGSCSPPFPSPVSREIQMFGPSSGVAQPDVSSPPGLGVCVFSGRGDGGLPVPGPPGEGASPLALGGGPSLPLTQGVSPYFLGVHFILVNNEKLGIWGWGGSGSPGALQEELVASLGTVPSQLGDSRVVSGGRLAQPEQCQDPPRWV